MQVLKELNVNGNFNIQKGYVSLGNITQVNKNPGSSNISAGSVYQKGNISRSFVNLTNLGTLIGAQTFDPTIFGSEILNTNLLISLLPGMSPSLSGTWSSDEEFYSLQDIISNVESDTSLFFSKILGMGLGNIIRLPVSTVNVNSTEFLSYTEYGTLPETVTSTSSATNINQVLNWGNGLETLESDEALTYPNPYLKGFDWQNEFGIQLFHGTNSFPFFGWAGTRIGDIDLVNSHKIQNAIYDFPATELNISLIYDSLGIVYAGQGTQYNSVFTSTDIQNRDIISRNIRKKETTLYRTKNKISTVNILPYQQGVGNYDFFMNSLNHNKTTSEISSSSTVDNIPAEGVQPGRNTAFAGVAITDFWSNSLDFTQINEGSKTSNVTRSKVSGIKQTQTAHNAPLCYIPVDGDLENNVLPWGSLFSYVGDTTTSPNYSRSENTSILQEGVTSMITTGAYPLFMGQWNSTISPTNAQFFSGSGNGLYQYYANVSNSDSSNWWNTIEDPGAPDKLKEQGDEPVLGPATPFTIKGASIFLFEGQRVKAGSYVYSSTTMTPSATAPHFYAPSGKRITFNSGEKDTLMGDIYSRFQGNQGGIIVMVSEDGKPPPMPPPCAQPIGIILEDIIGYGQPGNTEDTPLDPSRYGLQTDNSTAAQLEKPSNNSQLPIETNNIMAREILIKLLPMYANYYLPGVPDLVPEFSTTQSIVNPFSFTDNAGDLTTTYYPVYYRTKTNYAVTTGIFNGNQPNDQNWLYNQSSLSTYGLTFNRN
jgi:hypothetical protein